MKRYLLRLRLVQMALLGWMVFGSVYADDYTWTATSGTNNYNVSTNWDLNAVPGAGDRAFIPTSGSYTVTLSDSRSLADFTMGGAGVTLSHNDGVFSISNSININAGTYVFNGLSAWSLQAGSSINIASGATLNTFTQSSPGIFGATTITNAGTINGMSRGDFAISVTGNFTNSGTIHADNPQGFAISNLVIQNTGDFINTGVLSANSGINLGAPNQITLKPTGELNLNVGGTISVTNGGAIYIARDIPFASLGSWSITNTGSFGMTNGGTLIQGNSDTLTIDSAKDNFTLFIGNIKGGSINATGGTLIIRGTNNPNQTNMLDGVTNIRGLIDMTSQNSTLMLTGGTNFGPGAVIHHLSGTLHINQTTQLDHVTLNAGDQFAATQLNLMTDFNVGPTATLNLAGQNAPGMTGTGKLTNSGTINVTSRGVYPFVFDGDLENRGTLHADNPYGFAGSIMLIRNNGNFINKGILSVNGNETQGQLVRNTISILPTGSVTLDTTSHLIMTNTGQILFEGNAVTNKGQINITPGAFLQVGGGTGTLTNEAQVAVDGTLNAHVTVTSTGRISGSGSITGSVLVDGAIAPGDSPGSITVGSGIQLRGDYQWELGSHTTQGPGTNFDLIKLTTGSVNISSTALLRLNLPDGNTFNPFWAQNHEWTIIDNLNAANTINGFFATDHIFVGTQINGFFDTYIGGTDNNDLVLRWNFVSVPEPATWMLIGLGTAGGLAGVWFVRRKWQASMDQLVSIEVEIAGNID